jgi:uncharacterized protein YecE (DUF72 family)
VSRFRIGCAGWSIPSKHAGAFPTEGSHLERYAARFSAAEINSSFHRPHRTETYARWAAAVSAGFRFSVKVPKEITHTRKLKDVQPPVEQFLQAVAGLGEKLGPLLVQLPPSLAYDSAVAEAFFADLRRRFDGDVVCEPRHLTWFTREVEKTLAGFEVSRVAADPTSIPGADEPGGWSDLRYFRLHGSPRMYYSRYPGEFLDALASTLASAGGWCIFDNTAGGEAVANALELQERLADRPRDSSSQPNQF